jgi:hypothetical protein
VPGKQGLSFAIERVFDVAGQRYLAVRGPDGKLYRIGEDRLRWVWRLVLTSEGMGLGPMTAPVMLVIAQKASALRAGCQRCGRAGSAGLFRTVQREAADVYFTRCRRCWRSRHLGRVYREGVHAPPALAGPPAAGPADTLSTKAALAVAATLIGAIGLGLFLATHVL